LGGEISYEKEVEKQECLDSKYSIQKMKGLTRKAMKTIILEASPS